MADDIGIHLLHFIRRLLNRKIAERRWVLPAIVHRLEFLHVFRADGHRRSALLIKRKQIDQFLEDVNLEHHRPAFLQLDFRVGRREVFDRFYILVELEVETALEFAALARELLRVQGQLLVTGRRSGDAPEICQPTRTTQLAAANANATDPGGLLTRADLPHFNAKSEGTGKLPNEDSKIHAVVRRVIKCRFPSIALKLHVGELHGQTDLFDDFASALLGFWFAFAGFLPRIEVLLGRLAEDLFDLMVVANAFGLQLVPNQLPAQTDHAYILAWIGIDHNHVTHLQIQRLRPAVERLPVRLETHLNNIKRRRALWQRNPLQPIKNGHRAATAHPTTSIAFAPPRLAIRPIPAV